MAMGSTSLLLLCAVLSAGDKPPVTAQSKPPLGLHAKPFSEAKGTLLPSKVQSGVVVDSVDCDGLLERNGVEAADVLTRLGSKPIADAAQIEEWYTGAKIGTSIGLEYYRLEGDKYKRFSKKVVIEAQPADWLGERAYERYSQPARDKLKAAWREQLRTIRARYVGDEKNASGRTRKSEREARIRSDKSELAPKRFRDVIWKTRLDEIRRNVPPFLPGIYPPIWKVGDAGRLDFSARVVQIISPTEAILGHFCEEDNRKSENLFYIKDVKTDGWADGNLTGGNEPLEVYGTYRYTDAGVSHVVTAVRPLR
jgi:hypothetical protein